MLHSGKDAAPCAAQPPGSCSRGPEATEGFLYTDQNTILEVGILFC